VERPGCRDESQHDLGSGQHRQGGKETSYRTGSATPAKVISTVRVLLESLNPTARHGPSPWFVAVVNFVLFLSVKTTTLVEASSSTAVGAKDVILGVLAGARLLAIGGDVTHRRERGRLSSHSDHGHGPGGTSDDGAARVLRNDVPFVAIQLMEAKPSPVCGVRTHDMAVRVASLAPNESFPTTLCVDRQPPERPTPDAASARAAASVWAPS